MKAVQTRSPIHLAYEYANLNNVIVSIWVSDTPNIDSTTTPDYQLNSQAINDFATVEISELIRSKNDYIFNPDFYEKRDTAKYVLVKAVLLDGSNTELEVKYDFLRVRDGYVTRQDLPQIYKNIIATDFRDWSGKSNVAITPNESDPFSENNAYLIEKSVDTDSLVLNQFEILSGTYTISIFVKAVSDPCVLRIRPIFNTAAVDLDLRNETVNFTENSFISDFDYTRYNNFWNILSLVIHVDENAGFVIANDTSLPFAAIMFNPVITKGNRLNKGASELVLQDNTTIFSDSEINPKVLIDYKKSKAGNSFGGFSFGDERLDLIFPINLGQMQSYLSDMVVSKTLSYQDQSLNKTFQDVFSIELDECKHTPVKVSFINRFGVIQDLVFFKKRTDNIDTDKESYVTNVLQKGNYYPHIGQNQTIRKESKRSVTLNTGFYPEEFNTVFEQLQNSLYYWIDDEPAVLEGSNFNVKTRVNDKLINYTFDFSYSNEEVNTI